MVAEIHKRAIKASSKNFCTAWLIPKIARDRKGCVDKLLMELKKDHDDFRYIVRNGKIDLAKRTSKFSNCPYRPIPIESFGAISPLKTTFRCEDKDKEAEDVVNEEGFQRAPKKNLRAKFLPKTEIFERVLSFLDGLSVPAQRW